MMTFVGVEGVFITVDNNEVIQIWLLWYFIFIISQCRIVVMARKPAQVTLAKPGAQIRVCFTVIMVMAGIGAGTV